MGEDLVREAAQPQGSSIDLNSLPWSEAVQGLSIWRYRFKDGPIQGKEMEDTRFCPLLTIQWPPRGILVDGEMVASEEKRQWYSYWIKSYDWDRRIVTMQSSKRPGNADEIMRRFWKLQLLGKR